MNFYCRSTVYASGVLARWADEKWLYQVGVGIQFVQFSCNYGTEMSTISSTEVAADSMSVSDITVQHAAPADLYTGELDDIDSDELDSSQVINCTANKS